MAESTHLFNFFKVLNIMPKFSEVKIAVIGLGYVSLPLALAFAKHYPVIGFDINLKRVEELKAG